MNVCVFHAVTVKDFVANALLLGVTILQEATGTVPILSRGCLRAPLGPPTVSAMTTIGGIEDIRLECIK